jgi:hypothetical protein
LFVKVLFLLGLFGMGMQFARFAKAQLVPLATDKDGREGDADFEFVAAKPVPKRRGLRTKVTPPEEHQNVTRERSCKCKSPPRRQKASASSTSSRTCG